MGKQITQGQTIWAIYSQLAGDWQELTSANKGHLKTNGPYVSSITKEYLAYIFLVWEIENRDPINVICSSYTQDRWSQ